MQHVLEIRGTNGSHYVSAGCSCGGFSFFRNFLTPRGGKTEAKLQAKKEFTAHKKAVSA